MTANEHWTYQLICPQCKHTGQAEMSELDGWSYMRALERGNKVRWITLTDGFVLNKPPHPSEFIRKYPYMDERNDNITEVFCKKCEIKADAK